MPSLAAHCHASSPLRSRSQTARVAFTLARGFTLIEMIISAALLGFLAVTASYFWVDGFTLVRTVNADSAAMADGRAVLERLARELREAKYDTATGAYCVPTTTTTLANPATQFSFRKTTGSFSAACGTNDYLVTVALASPQVNLSYAGALAPVAATSAMTGYASALQIRHLDAVFAATTSAAAVRYLELSLTVQPTGVQATPARLVVALRNN
jgi:prepilin-type N-terminal cleavage/methylation domain-containing protein